VVAEYRALRAGVIRLWRHSEPQPDVHDLDDVTRFHEAMDQSLSQAVRGYTGRINRSRQMFLAILGHDLRSPLNAIRLGAQLLVREMALDAEMAQNAVGIAATANAMGHMIADLLDFTSADLGAAMPITRARVDLRRLCAEVIDEIRSRHPMCTLTFTWGGGGDGDLVVDCDPAGEWDGLRLRQLISNLLGNAIQHGSAECRLGLSVSGDASEVSIAVHNEGPPIPPDVVTTIFDPLVRIASPELQRRRRPGSIGLGLYIAREVAAAHGGTIDVQSSAEAGTTFTARLPRKPNRSAS
jgi:signal transduction histidine kinase